MNQQPKRGQHGKNVTIGSHPRDDNGTIRGRASVIKGSKPGDREHQTGIEHAGYRRHQEPYDEGNIL